MVDFPKDGHIYKYAFMHHVDMIMYSSMNDNSNHNYNIAAMKFVHLASYNSGLLITNYSLVKSK